MSLNSFVSPEVRNKFCELKNLRNESDVEQFFAIVLLKDLGYSEDLIATKTTINEESIGKGRKRRKYRPDYLVYLDKDHKKPVLVIDAKSPTEKAEEGLSDAQLYVSIIRRKLEPPKPTQYCIGTNGLRLIIKHYDSDVVELELSFSDFQEDNIKYEQLKSKISLESLTKFREAGEVFQLSKPPIKAVIEVFEDCHNLIWKTEKRSPSSAFYEFVKIMFVKINEDKKLRDNEELRRKIERGEPLPKEKIIFSTHWIEREEQTDPNPIDSILFKNLRVQLESEILNKKKKRIFDPDERIDLEPSTIREVVKLLEPFDLFGIDEDLNGRLFETFLNATMRGRELGQYFTPRSVVKFITDIANLRASKERIDRILDACCGTAGFLIEAMADLSGKIDLNPSLSNREKRELIDFIKNECLYGIDAGKSPPIARIARINMFLHGDGGSRIYFADSLDKKRLIETGLDEELKRDRQELRKKIKEENLKFDVVLTNPPFAMKYSKDKKTDIPLLEQYEIAYKEGIKELYNTSQSNILFLERYKELLKEDGKLLTVIDDTPLNGAGGAAKRYRKFIRKYFIIKAVISLPQNTFKLAEGGTKTSVLFLRKKKNGEEQPSVFMAICDNIGHDNLGRPTPELNELPSIAKEYKNFEKTGKLIDSHNESIFVVSPRELKDEINAYFYSPEYKRIQRELKLMEEQGIIKLVQGRDLLLVKDTTEKEKKVLRHEIFKYFELRDVTLDGTIVSYIEDKLGNLPTRAKKSLKTNDVIMSRNAGSLGKIVIIPLEFDGQFCSDGFLVFRSTSEDDAYLLAGILRSDIVQKQMFYSQREAVQPDIKPETFKKRVLIPFLIDEEEKKRIITTTKEIEQSRSRINSLRFELSKMKIGK